VPQIELTGRLAEHGNRVRVLPSNVMGDQSRRFDPHRRELMLSELLGEASRRFQIGVLLAWLEQDTVIAQTLKKSGLTDSSALLLARVTVANYFAAALLMPYRWFLAACESLRFDVESISHRFGTSDEQTAHRMSTLQRADARGIPFFFCAGGPGGKHLQALQRRTVCHFALWQDLPPAEQSCGVRGP